MPDFGLEHAAGGLVAGVDEAGRGPLAGPVMAGCVLFFAAPDAELAVMLDDSKRLSPAQRQFAHDALWAAARAGVLRAAVGAASATEIAQRNILGATHLAMSRAVARLGLRPDLVLVDGNRAPPLTVPVRCVIGGDGISLSIAAASILAKVTRDRCMARLGARWPAYGFARHQGYPTAAHRAALAQTGPCAHHRRGFAPVDAAWAAQGSA
ncbi:ribonuclease HII [Humitalea sp. 24SJ18S-53]|uniref:ribonuclease HII n=1 Tax=Humitalea sp. 24SJ18S-53 TaxID=3422307 RepID=UPI003D67C620